MYQLNITCNQIVQIQYNNNDNDKRVTLYTHVRTYVPRKFEHVYAPRVLKFGRSRFRYSLTRAVAPRVVLFLYFTRYRIYLAVDGLSVRLQLAELALDRQQNKQRITLATIARTLNLTYNRNGNRAPLILKSSLIVAKATDPFTPSRIGEDRQHRTRMHDRKARIDDPAYHHHPFYIPWFSRRYRYFDSRYRD